MFFTFYMYILFFIERYLHGIFADGGALVLTQEKKKNEQFNLHIVILK